MRPRSIARFSLFHLSSIAVILANNLIHWEVNRANLDAGSDPRFVSLSWVLAGAAFAIPLLLWGFVLWRRSALACWLIVALTLPWAPGLVNAVGVMPPLMVFLTSLGLALQCIALYFLFREESRRWLKGTS